MKTKIINNEEWVSKKPELIDFKKNLKKLGLSKEDWVDSYTNGDYKYRKDGVSYLLNSEGKLKCKGDWVNSYDNGDCEYEEDEVYYLLNSEGKLKCKGDYVYSYDNGNCGYRKDGVKYDYIKKEKCWEVNGVKYYKK